MRTFITVLIFLIASTLVAAQSSSPAKKLNDLFSHRHKNVLVAAHRGDWRNAPENSVQGLRNCIVMGVDIAEFDLKKTKDGRLVVMHDNTIDRSTAGKGKPEDFTWDTLSRIALRSGTGHPTRHTIPSFTDMLLAAKGKIIVDIGKGYEYYDAVMKELREQQ